MRRPGGGAVVALAVALVVALGLGATGCTGAGSGDQADPGGSASTIPRRPSVVASTPLVGALVRAVVGDQAEVRVVLGPDDEPATAVVHEPFAWVVGADVLVVVDPADERALEPVISQAEDASPPVPVVALAPQLNPVPLGGSELDPGSTAAVATDPHVWFDPDRWTQAARLVGDAVAVLPGVDAAAIQANVAAFDAAASRADEIVQATFTALPEGPRTVVTDLPALAYVADRYGLDLVLADGPEGLATAAATHGTGSVFVAAGEQEATAAALAALAPGITVVGLDLDGRTATATPGAGPEGYATLIVAVARAVAGGLAA